MIIDFHTHLFPPGIRSDRTSYISNEPAFKLLYESEKSKMIGAGELIESMDQQGVERSVVFGFPWQNPETIQKHNDYIIEAVARYPERLIGFCCFDMRYPHASEETARCLEAGLSGVGELAAYTDGIDQSVIKNLTRVMDICREKNLPLLLHANEPVGHIYPGKAPDSLTDVYGFIKSFPDNVIVLAHWGGGLFFYSLMKKEVNEMLANVYFDTAASPFLYKKEIYQVSRDLIGIDKILFGSDFPLIKPERYFEELNQSGLTEDEIMQVKGGNAAKIFYLA